MNNSSEKYNSRTPHREKHFSQTRDETKPKQSGVISTNTSIFEQGFTVPGRMYANLPSYRCYLPDCADSTPPILPFPEPQVKWLVIGGQNTAAMATSCLANSPLAEGGETGL